MAVNIDTVYQRVLAIANKEQRGYITPQEFNLFANQAQMSIFEQYFYDINQFGRIPGTDHTYSDMKTLLEEKISIFKKRHQPITITNFYGDGDLPTDMYRLGTVLRYGLPNSTNANAAEIERLSEDEYMYYNASPLASPSKQRPIYLRTDSNSIKIYPNSGGLNENLNKSAVSYFTQTGVSQYNGQDNQFYAGGVSLYTGFTQAQPSKELYLPALGVFLDNAIEAGQIVTSNVANSLVNNPPTRVVSFDKGAVTTLTANAATGQTTISVAVNTNIKIGQYVNFSNGSFPNTFVAGVDGAVITVKPILPAGATLASGGTVTFLSLLVLDQTPLLAINGANNLLTFSQDTISYIEVGQSVTNAALPVGTTVTAVNNITKAVTLSNGFNLAGNRILTFASDDIKCNYVRKPIDVTWNYNLINSTAMYNSGNSINFELHESEETGLVIKILALAGIAIKDTSIYQIATAEEQRTIQQEKQ